MIIPSWEGCLRVTHSIDERGGSVDDCIAVQECDANAAQQNS